MQFSQVLHFVRVEKASLDLLEAGLMFLSEHYDDVVDVEENKDLAVVEDAGVLVDRL